ncbi:MAG TPA: YbhN family protein [Actinomycetota bacterium]
MDKRSRKRAFRIAEIVVSIAIVVGIFAFAIPKFASYGDVWAAVQEMTWLEIATLVGISVFNIATYWPMMVASMPGLTFGQAAVNNQSSSSIANTLPGGGLLATGVTYTMYRSWGFTNTQIGLTALITGIWNAFVKLAMPVMALAALAITGQGSTTLLIPALIGLAILLAAVALFAGVLWKKSLARAIGGGLGKVASAARRVVRKPSVHWGEAAVRFRKQTLGLLSRRWPALTISALVSHFSLYLVLLVALRHVGVSDQEIGWAQALGVFAFVRLITLVPLTPGGVGLVELGYIGGLYVAGRDAADVPIELFRAQITAAVLVFRTLTYALQIPTGALTYVIWQRKRSWRKPVPTEEPPETAMAATPG